MAKKNTKEKKQDKTEIKENLNSYLIRFSLIYCANIIILLSLKYQVGLSDTLIFAVVIIILSARFTATKFIMDKKRLFTQPEKMKFIWASWGIVWFISIISTTILTYVFAGKEALDILVSTFSTMPSVQFIITIAAASAICFALLYVTYGFNAKREFKAFKEQGKI